MIKKAHIVYFSGTGGTALAAQTLSDSLMEKGVEIRLSEIFREDMPEIKPDESLILMYPVYAADAPGPVYKWIDSTEKTQNRKATVISVSGGGEVSPNTACRVKAVKRLGRKGFKVINEYMLCMPSNFIMPTPIDLAVKLIRVLPEKCGKIAEEIVSETPGRKKPLFLDRITIIFFSMEKLGSKVFGKTLKAFDECNGCGLCAKTCPRGNIMMDGGRPKYGWKCVICMRCVYACPKHAIRVRLPLLKNAVLKDGFDLRGIQMSAEAADDKADEISDTGLLWEAVVRYIGSGRI